MLVGREALREQRGIARYVEEVVGADELGDVGLWDREDGEGYRKALASAISKIVLREHANKHSRTPSEDPGCRPPMYSAPVQQRSRATKEEL